MPEQKDQQFIDWKLELHNLHQISDLAEKKYLIIMQLKSI